MKKQGGFTLIELVLVIGLLAISVGVTNDILISLIRSNNKTQIIGEIEQQSNFVSLKIEKELRNARVASVPADGDSGTTLNFETRDGDQIEYNVDVDSGVVYRVEGVGGPSLELTNNAIPGGVKVVCGVPNCFSVSGANPQIVSMKMIFSQSQSNPIASFAGTVNIDSTVVIRNTY